MNIRSSIYALAIVFAVLCTAAACGTREKRTAFASDTISITSETLSGGMADTLRFGRMRQGERAVKTLRLENASPSPVVLVRHAASCGCVTVRYDRKPVPSGGSTDMEFEFDSRGEYGWQMKLMEFYFADSDRPLKIYVEAEVE